MSFYAIQVVTQLINSPPFLNASALMTLGIEILRFSIPNNNVERSDIIIGT